MLSAKPTTGKYSQKPYRCTRCGHDSTQGTNHWGEIYIRCNQCSWKNPMQPTATHECQEPCPETHDKPAPWQMVRLGDVAEIIQGRERNA